MFVHQAVELCVPIYVNWSSVPGVETTVIITLKYFPLLLKDSEITLKKIKSP